MSVADMFGVAGVQPQVANVVVAGVVVDVVDNLATSQWSANRLLDLRTVLKHVSIRPGVSQSIAVLTNLAAASPSRRGLASPSEHRIIRTEVTNAEHWVINPCHVASECRVSRVVDVLHGAGTRAKGTSAAWLARKVLPAVAACLVNRALLSLTNTLHRAVARTLARERFVRLPALFADSCNHFNIIANGWRSW